MIDRTLTQVAKEIDAFMERRDGQQREPAILLRAEYCRRLADLLEFLAGLEPFGKFGVYVESPIQPNSGSLGSS